MLLSPYFPIRFKGVFIAYQYIHIPQIFPTGFFEEFKHTATLISKNIRSRGSVTKHACLPTDTYSTDDLIRTSKQLGLEIRLAVNFPEQSCPYDFRMMSVQCDPSLVYISKRSMKSVVIPKSCSFHSLFNMLSALLYWTRERER